MDIQDPNDEITRLHVTQEELSDQLKESNEINCETMKDLIVIMKRIVALYHVTPVTVDRSME